MNRFHTDWKKILEMIRHGRAAEIAVMLIVSIFCCAVAGSFADPWPWTVDVLIQDGTAGKGDSAASAVMAKKPAVTPRQDPSVSGSVSAEENDSETSLPAQESVETEAPPLTEAERMAQADPSPVRLNTAYEFAADAAGDASESSAGKAFRRLAALDEQWVERMYSSRSTAPGIMAVNLGVTGQRIGDYSDWTNVGMIFYDGDGKMISGYSNAKEILAMASVYSYFHPFAAEEELYQYTEKLWSASHRYSLSVSGVYFCDGPCKYADDWVSEDDSDASWADPEGIAAANTAAEETLSFDGAAESEAESGESHGPLGGPSGSFDGTGTEGSNSGPGASASGSGTGAESSASGPGASETGSDAGPEGSISGSDALGTGSGAGTDGSASGQISGGDSSAGGTSTGTVTTDEGSGFGTASAGPGSGSSTDISSSESASGSNSGQGALGAADSSSAQTPPADSGSTSETSASDSSDSESEGPIGGPLTAPEDGTVPTEPMPLPLPMNRNNSSKSGIMMASASPKSGIRTASAIPMAVGIRTVSAVSAPTVIVPDSSNYPIPSVSEVLPPAETSAPSAESSTSGVLSPAETSAPSAESSASGVLSPAETSAPSTEPSAPGVLSPAETSAPSAESSASGVLSPAETSAPSTEPSAPGVLSPAETAAPTAASGESNSAGPIGDPTEDETTAPGPGAAASGNPSQGDTTSNSGSSAPGASSGETTAPGSESNGTGPASGETTAPGDAASGDSSDVTTTVPNTGESVSSSGTAVTAVPQGESSSAAETKEEKPCPGHVDLTIRATIIGLNGNKNLFSLDSRSDSEEDYTDTWKGWSMMRKRYVDSLLAQDWYELYGLTTPASMYIQNPLTASEINSYMAMLPADISEERKALIQLALQSVGCIPYYWGGKPSGPGFDANGFGTLVYPDENGRSLRGLDCSGWISWLYWTALGIHLPFESTSGLYALGRQVDRSELKPGDYIVRTGDDAHVCLFLAWAPDGSMYVIHERGSSSNNVIVSKIDLHWPYYRNLLD